MSGKATVDQADLFYERTSKTSPKWSMATKPEMVIGGSVPSWTKTIPGPKYEYDTDVYKRRVPAFSIGAKLDLVVGGDIPSWKASIPGPYQCDPDVIKPKPPAYSMGMRRSQSDADKTNSLARAGLRLTTGFNQIKKRQPSAVICSRTEDLPSWKKDIPGPYTWNPDTIKKKPPEFSIGRKLPTESDLMKSRSPGPMQYGGSAMDAKKQAEVDSTKRRTPSCAILSRKEDAMLVKSTALRAASEHNRYERPVLRRRAAR